MTEQEVKDEIQVLIQKISNYAPQQEWKGYFFKLDSGNHIGFVGNKHVEFIIHAPFQYSLSCKHFEHNRLEWVKDNLTWHIHDQPIWMLQEAKKQLMDNISTIQFTMINI